jgi:hypothetical protein
LESGLRCAQFLKLSKNQILVLNLRKKNNADKYFDKTSHLIKFPLKQPSIELTRVLNQKEAKILHAGTVNFLWHAPESERAEQRLQEATLHIQLSHLNPEHNRAPTIAYFACIAR